jgi:glutamyl-tRNA reductase
MNHRSAPVELREKLSFDPERTAKGLEELARRTDSAEAVILSTCNRVEITAFRDDDRELPDALERFLAEFHGVPRETVAPHLYRLRGTEAVRHLFRVASSLDSMVPGESQILAQVKEAYLLAAENGYTGKHLNVLFQRAFRVGKLVHTVTDIARHKVSVSSVAVDLARGVFGDLSAKTVLVVGAGETGKLTLRSLVEAGVGRVLVTSRTASRADEVAVEFGGAVVDFARLVDHVREADIVISSTASPGFVLGPDDVRSATAGRESRPLLIIDIAVPRDVHPGAAQLPGVHLRDIDDLEKVVAENIDRREQEFEHSLELVEEEVTAFGAWFDGHEVDEMIGELYIRVQAASDAELEKLWSKIPALSEPERDEVRESVRRIVRRILHGHMEVFRRELGTRSPQDMRRIVRRIFHEDDHDAPDADVE